MKDEAPVKRARRRRTDVCAHHTVTQAADGAIHVTSVVTTHWRYEPMDNGNLRALLRTLMDWTPCDNHVHVVTQIRKGRTYLIRAGAKDSVRFAD